MLLIYLEIIHFYKAFDSKFANFKFVQPKGGAANGGGAQAGAANGGANGAANGGANGAANNGGAATGNKPKMINCQRF